MPEIGEVARAVHFIQKYLVGKTLAAVKAQHDENVFGKVGTSAAEFEKSLTGKKVVDARQQGKYFWIIMSKPPHPLCHFGMAGWFEIRNVETTFRKASKTGKSKDDSIWPPKYWKFSFETAEEPKCEAAFVDLRRFGRVRLIDCAADDIRLVSPLKENGPDPVVDREIVTKQWLAENLSKKKLHVKTFLLDQAIISGIGNWVGDEILYQAAIHPEQSTQNLSPAQISRLYTSLHHVTSHAVSTLADPNQIPDSWLFEHRWGKGKKDSSNTLPNGASISFVTVGGRTSAVVASVQKKTGSALKVEDVEEDIIANAEDAAEESKKSRGKKGVPGKKSKATKAPVEPNNPAKSPKTKSRSLNQDDHPTAPDAAAPTPSTKPSPDPPERTTPANRPQRKTRIRNENPKPLSPAPTPPNPTATKPLPQPPSPQNDPVLRARSQKRKPSAQSTQPTPKKQKLPTRSLPATKPQAGAHGDGNSAEGEDASGRRRSTRVRKTGS